MKARIVAAMVMMSVASLCGCAYGGTDTFYQVVTFKSNVFLHDAPTVPLHTRVPTGEVARFSGGILQPEGSFQINGSLTASNLYVMRNGVITLTHKPSVADAATGVTIDPNGQITLNRFVAGVGWTNVVINPTNPLPAGMVPTSTNYVMRVGQSANIIPSPLNCYADEGSLNWQRIYNLNSTTNGRFFVGGRANDQALVLIDFDYISAVLSGYAGMQRGYIEGYGSATNSGIGSIGLFNLTGTNSQFIGGNASIGLGAVVVTNSESLVAGNGSVSHGDGSISAKSFWGDGSHLSNLWLFSLYIPSNSSATASNYTLSAAGGCLYVCQTNSWGGVGTNWLKFTGSAF